MTSLQSKSAGALLAALGTRGHSGISCAAHDGDATRLDITIASGAWAVLADGTVLADELASTHIDGLTSAGNYRLWLDYVEVAAAYEPVWTLTSITPTPPTPSALDICTVDVGAGGISAIGATEGGLRSLPQQTSTATLPAGVPTLRGPFIVDWSDIPHDGDKKDLWVPQVGDVLLRLVGDKAAHTVFDHGALYVGQGVDGTVAPPLNAFGYQQSQSGSFTNELSLTGFDLAYEGVWFDASGNGQGSTVYVFHTTDPVQIQLAQTGGTDPTQGHCELYALVARAVSP